MFCKIRNWFEKVANLFKKNEVSLTQKVEAVVEKEPIKHDVEEVKPKPKQEVEVKKETKSKVTNELKAHSRENKEKKFEHSAIVDKNIWE